MELKMNRAERDEWVAALRSGEYKQGSHHLDQNGKQCCLGVKCLLDIAAGRYDLSIRTSADNMPSVFGIDSYYTFACLPSESLRKAWGLSAEAVGKLAEMNDEKGRSFGEIADWIEENVPVKD